MKSQANRDAFLRINFLYQAAHSTLVQNPDNTQLARFYITTLKTVAKRLVLRIHPNIKRTICKRCDLLLIPGITATVRVRARREQHLVLTCLDCKQVKRFLCRENYQLWIENAESKLAPQTDSKKNTPKQKTTKKSRKGQASSSQDNSDATLEKTTQEAGESGPSSSSKAIVASTPASTSTLTMETSKQLG